MQKNVAGQKWVVFAFNINNNNPQTGDAANITANLRIDGSAADAVDDTNPTELEDGYYVFDITQAESNGNQILIAPASGTANIQVIGVPGVYDTDGLTVAEKNQIRHRLNIDGTQAAPTAGGAAKLAGTDADLTLNSLVIDNTTTNGTAMTLLGDSTGDGLKIKGGVVGHGMHCVGGASLGHGIFAEAPGGTGAGEDSDGIRAEKNVSSVGSAIRAIVKTPAIGDGLKITGGVGADDNGIHAESGSGAAGDGTRFEAKSTNGNGLKLIKTGTGKDIAAVEIDDIKAKTDNLAFTSGNVHSDMKALNAVADSAANLEQGAAAIAKGAAIAGTLSTTEMTTDLTETTNNHYKGLVLKWTTGALAEQGTEITAYDGATKKLTYTAVTDAPAATDKFVIN